MRKLLNTLFVTTEYAYLSLENENVVVTIGEDKAGNFPLRILEGIVCFSYRGASPALMGACAKNGIQLSFLTPNGRFLAQACGEVRGNVLLRKEQFRRSENPAESCRIARNMILGKVFNSRWVLERSVRDHPLNPGVDSIKQASLRIKTTLQLIKSVEDNVSLRGLEGNASKEYFDAFDWMILSQKNDFVFKGRSRQPPLDRVNAVLSFAYTLLFHDCTAALNSVGLDAYVGFLHRDRPGRPSLALDLMEELRSVVADRFTLFLINNGMIRGNHFDEQENGAIMMNDEGRKIFLEAWQKRKQEKITHPYMQEKIPWGLVPYAQALLLARTLRNDCDQYPPFLWK